MSQRSRTKAKLSNAVSIELYTYPRMPRSTLNLSLFLSLSLYVSLSSTRENSNNIKISNIKYKNVRFVLKWKYQTQKKRRGFETHGERVFGHVAYNKECYREPRRERKREGERNSATIRVSERACDGAPPLLILNNTVHSTLQLSAAITTSKIVIRLYEFLYDNKQRRRAVKYYYQIICIPSRYIGSEFSYEGRPIGNFSGSWLLLYMSTFNYL